ncbi:MAG: trigger factor [Verrucomicrobiota bacterium]
MNIEIKDVSDTRKELVVSLDQAEVAAQHQAVIGEISKVARLPGFRPGKAPANLVIKRYGKEIGEEFKQKVVTKAYRDGLEQSKLDVLQITGVDEGTIAADQAATITITVDLRPTFELPDYAGLATTVTAAEPTDAEVDAAIEELRGQRAEFNVAERASQKGDYVKLSYTGTVEGQPILEIVPDKQIYGSVPQTWEEVEGENEGLIPGLGNALAGLAKGDKKDVTVTFPAEFAGAPALAGKTAVYSVEIQEIRERVLPALDEAFFKANQADDLAGLKSKTANNLKLRKEHQNRQAQRQQVVEALTGKTEFAVPESLIEAETQSVLRRFMEENMRRGVPAEQFEKDKTELFDNARKAATTRVKTQFILSKIAEKEGLKVDERDIDTFIYREAMMTNSTPEKLVKELTKDRERLRAIQQSIIFDKALDLVVSKATVSTAEATA